MRCLSGASMLQPSLSKQGGGSLRWSSERRSFKERLLGIIWQWSQLQTSLKLPEDSVLLSRFTLLFSLREKYLLCSLRERSVCCLQICHFGISIILSSRQLRSRYLKNALCPSHVWNLSSLFYQEWHEIPGSIHVNSVSSREVWVIAY